MTRFIDHYELAIDTVKAGDVTPMMLFPIGVFKSAKYPELALTRELADEVIANFAAGVLGTEPVVETSGNHNESAPAGGWVKRVYVAPMKDGKEAAFADVEWTEIGAEKLNGREYRYNSMKLGPVVDNVTGARTDNVLRSVTLTNTPVLRMLPPVLEAGDAIAEPVDVALSEIEAAEKVTKSEGDAGEFPAAAYAYVPDPESPSTWKLRLWATPDGGPDPAVVGAACAALGPGFRGQKVAIPAADLPAVKAKVRAAWKQANPDKDAADMPQVIKASEDDGPPADPHPASSEPVSPSAKGAEGQPVTLAGGDAAQKGVPRMDPTILKTLKLAEGASEDDVRVAVLTLSESLTVALTERDAEKARADAAEATIAEEAKKVRAAEVERTLTELVTGGHLLPGQKDEMLALAEDSPSGFDKAVAVLKTAKAIQLGESGSGKAASEYDDPSVELAEKAKARAKADGIGVGEAQRLVLSEDTGLAQRIHEERYGRKES